MYLGFPRNSLKAIPINHFKRFPIRGMASFYCINITSWLLHLDVHEHFMSKAMQLMKTQSKLMKSWFATKIMKIKVKIHGNSIKTSTNQNISNMHMH